MRLSRRPTSLLRVATQNRDGQFASKNGQKPTSVTRPYYRKAEVFYRVLRGAGTWLSATTSLFVLGSRSPARRRADRFGLIAARQGQPALFDCEEIRPRRPIGSSAGHAPGLGSTTVALQNHACPGFFGHQRPSFPSWSDQRGVTFITNKHLRISGRVFISWGAARLLKQLTHP
jgi:hypothetical protein